MDKLLLKLLVIGIVVSLAWNAALSWAVFSGPSEQMPLRATSSSYDPWTFVDTEAARRDRQLDALIAEAEASPASTKLVRPTTFTDDDLIDERIDRLEQIVCPKRLDC